MSSDVLVLFQIFPKLSWDLFQSFFQLFFRLFRFLFFRFFEPFFWIRTKQSELLYFQDWALRLGLVFTRSRSSLPGSRACNFIGAVAQRAGHMGSGLKDAEGAEIPNHFNPQPVSTCFNVFQEEKTLVTLIESIAQSIDIIDLECMIEPYQGAEYRLGSACDAWCTTWTQSCTARSVSLGSSSKVYKTYSLHIGKIGKCMTRCVHAAFLIWPGTTVQSLCNYCTITVGTVQNSLQVCKQKLGGPKGTRMRWDKVRWCWQHRDLFSPSIALLAPVLAALTANERARKLHLKAWGLWNASLSFAVHTLERWEGHDSQGMTRKVYIYIYI